MDRNRIKRLVITNSDNEVIGVVSRPDLIRLFTGKHKSQLEDADTEWRLLSARSHNRM